jgi:hypothetical protein
MNSIDRRLYEVFKACHERGLPLDETIFSDGIVGKHAVAAKLESQLRAFNEQSGPTDEQPA